MLWCRIGKWDRTILGMEVALWMDLLLGHWERVRTPLLMRGMAVLLPAEGSYPLLILCIMMLLLLLGKNVGIVER